MEDTVYGLFENDGSRVCTRQDFLGCVGKSGLVGGVGWLQRGMGG